MGSSPLHRADPDAPTELAGAIVVDAWPPAGPTKDARRAFTPRPAPTRAAHRGRYAPAQQRHVYVGWPPVKMAIEYDKRTGHPLWPQYRPSYKENRAENWFIKFLLVVAVALVLITLTVFSLAAVYAWNYVGR